MMYYYWSRHAIRPSVFYNMPPGEKLMIRAFYEQERAEVNDIMKESGSKVFPVVDILQMNR